MTPFWEFAGTTLYCGDCRSVLAQMEAGSVQCVVTSPPYFGLRDYGTAAWEGGEVGCDHTMPSRVDAIKAVATSTLVGSKDTQGHLKEPSYRDTCGKCGARRVDSQIGLEQTPVAYVAELVGVMREVRRVLRNDGTCWINLGDSFGANKQLQMIPARVALALQADGWVLRSDIIWAKPNPMPESVTDRPTRSHEYIFMLTKSARYYYDADAIREPMAEASAGRYAYGFGGAKNTILKATDKPTAVVGTRVPTDGRNKRDVWTVATQSYDKAHFATFPPKLIEPCILAGTSERGACGMCGAPWRRVTQKSRTFESGSGRSGNDPVGKNGAGMQGGGETRDIRRGPVVHVETTGWEPTCTCDAATVPCTVLDPFCGSGTTLMVAQKHGRRAVGIELSPDYCTLAVERCGQSALPLVVSA